MSLHSRISSQVTVIDDPYEEPENHDIVVDSSDTDPEILVQEILLKIDQLVYI